MLIYIRHQVPRRNVDLRYHAIVVAHRDDALQHVHPGQPSCAACQSMNTKSVLNTTSHCTLLLEMHPVVLHTHLMSRTALLEYKILQLRSNLNHLL